MPARAGFGKAIRDRRRMNKVTSDVSTGNGLFDAASQRGLDYGDTLLKLKLQGSRLMVADYFTPANERDLNSADGDLGSGGPVLLPDKSGTHSAGLVFGGKQGILYNLDPAHMGHLQAEANGQTLQSIRLSDGIYAAAAYWNGNCTHMQARIL